MNSSKGIKCVVVVVQLRNSEKERCFLCRTTEELVAPAKTWEQNGDYSRAVNAYMKITVQQSSDYDFLAHCWKKVILCE